MKSAIKDIAALRNILSKFDNEGVEVNGKVYIRNEMQVNMHERLLETCASPPVPASTPPSKSDALALSPTPGSGRTTGMAMFIAAYTLTQPDAKVSVIIGKESERGTFFTLVQAFQDALGLEKGGTE
jgi:hypothetical protein